MLHRYQPITVSHTELIKSGGPRDPHVDGRRRHLASGFNPHERQLPALFVHLTETRPGSLPTPGVQPGGPRSRVRRPGIAVNALVAGASLFCRRRLGFDGDQFG
jgi:hypothetical protein